MAEDNFYDYPFPGKREQTIVLKIKTLAGNLEERFVLKYSQATIAETIEYMKAMKSDETLNKRFVEFLMESGKCTDSQIALLQRIPKKYTEVFEKVTSRRFRGVFQKAKKTDKKPEESSGYGMPYSAMIALISKNYPNIPDPREFQLKYTFEEMSYLFEGASFIANEQSEEGRQENERKMFAGKHSDSELIKKLFTIVPKKEKKGVTQKD